MGGEKCCRLPCCPAGWGSPPRGRGKEIVDVTEWPTNRITPAWAGKSAHELFEVIPNEDHPRVGGEKGSRYREQVRALGSPPRGRGKDHRPPTGSSPSRITPAWAGKSPTLPESVRGLRDHPRVGGEKLELENALLLNMGSPPRGRGKGPGSAGACARHGITPAWAGKRDNNNDF